MFIHVCACSHTRFCLQNWHIAAILVCSTELVVKANVPLYEAREALYAKSVVEKTSRPLEKCSTTFGKAEAKQKLRLK